MPPEYETQERSAPIPGVMAQDHTTLANFGGGPETAKALSAAGSLTQDAAETFAQLAKQAKEEIDMGAVSGAAAKLSALQTRLLHDPKTGALNTRGENSFGVYQPTMEGFKKGAGEIQQSLTTPEQKSAFQRHVLSQTSLMDRSLQEHVSVQRQGYVRGSLTSAAEQYGNAAEANATTNLQATKTNVLLQKGELLKLAQFEGLSDSAAAAFVADQESKTQARIINMMLANQHDQTAKAYFDSLPPGTIRNEEGIQVARALEIGSTRAAAGQATREIMAPTLGYDKDGQMTATPKTEGETFALAEKIKDQKLQDEVKRRVRESWEDKHRAEAEDQNEAIEQAKGYLIGKGVDPKTANIDNIPPDVLSRLKPGSIGKLYTLARELRAGEHVSTDPVTFHELMQQARDPKTRDDFIKRNLFEDYGKLSTADRKNFEDMQTKLSGEDPKSSSTLGFHDRIEKTMLSNNKINGPAHELRGDDAKRYAQFSLSADARIRAFEANELKGKGRAANPQEQQNIIDTMLQERSPETKGWIWKDPLVGGEVLASEVTVPKNLKTEMEAHVKTLNKTSNDDKLRRMYRAMLAGDRVAYNRIANE